MAECFCLRCDANLELGTAGSSTAEGDVCCRSRNGADAIGDLVECETGAGWFIELLKQAGAVDGAAAKKRKMAYKEYVALKHGTLGYKVRVNIPTCVKGVIRSTFPDMNDIGFMKE